MYAVIFKAQIRQLDQEYYETAKRMRELAMRQYGCIEFVSLTEGDREISISYWDTQAQIQQWKHDTEHLSAKALGKSRWYQSYEVEVVEIVHAYSFPD